MLDKEKSQGNDSKLRLNVIYYPVFRYLKSQLKELHIILACDEDHKKVFPEVLIISFKNNKNLRSHLVRPALPVLMRLADANHAVEKDLLVHYAVT